MKSGTRERCLTLPVIPTLWTSRLCRLRFRRRLAWMVIDGQQALGFVQELITLNYRTQLFNLRNLA